MKKVFLILLMTNTLVSCYSPGQRELEFAGELISKGKFINAIDSLDKAILRAKDNEIALLAMREAARVSYYELKDFKRAAGYYQKLVLSSSDPVERINSQRSLSQIYFEQLNDYSRAVIELNKLIAMTPNSTEQQKMKMDLARSYYYQNNFIQAESEIDELLKKSNSKDRKFEMMVLKGNIYLAQKDLQKAAIVFKQLVQENPQKATKDNVALTLAVAYEEMKDYKNAIEILQAMKVYHPMPEYLDIRIKRLYERNKNQPGARGMRK